MITLLADENIGGHVARLAARLQSDDWREFWDHLQLQCLTFADLSLVASDSDATVWKCCQQNQACLITSNRNDDGPDSLETTIRTCNTAESLPVFTIGNADKVLQSAAYADNVIDTLLQYLLRIDALRGTGRLYLP